jgi:uncharacterized damage-inducible protein DinB
MTKQREELLNQLSATVQNHQQRISLLRERGLEALNQRPGEGKWTALECLEHLNRYGEFYLPAIEKKLLAAKQAPHAVAVRPGILGGYSARKMLPDAKTGKLWKMNTFRKMNPKGEQQDMNTLQQFAEQNRQMLLILDRCRNYNLSRTHIRLTMPLLRFRLGDLLQFMINHNERHIQQAERAMEG